MKTTYSLLACSALCAISTMANAEATLYGQVNKGLFVFNDGGSTETIVGDNALGSTRVGFKAATLLDNGLTASVLFENEMASNATSSQTQDTTAGLSNTPASNTPAFAERQARVGISSRTLGSVYLGQQSTAIDGILSQDLTGAQDVMTADYRKIGGGFKFRNSTTNAFTAFTINGETSDISVKRADSVRYDSPYIGPMQLRASVAQGGDLEAAATFQKGFGDFKLKGGAGVEFNNDLATATNVAERRYSASASASHKSGVAATVAYAASDLSNKTATAEDPSQWYGKVGYTWGQDSMYEVAADYGQANHYGSATATEDEFTAWGLAAQYNIMDGVSVATLYRNFDLERTGTNTDSVDLYGVNMRVKF